ncbi:unnamed protein product [Didymodactylos carnosus]|uniref:Uncharacterized protein n=1 Tax=Didymodactylos carnosus TaxID=1234261 RepID=A0A814QB05_9BILA|nr:unnamed protein product [Didymodactylos carnosus]CAF1117495.1 unnamed protein product [Didymodactylos carnosus]CAF3726073.1 unnamed protein product [Didymodactylos carnosus]CAF3881285.1 unnamed protein product [Didymodactylos carnosus]
MLFPPCKVDIDRLPDEFKKEGLKDEEAVAKANKIIDGLKDGGEARLPHLRTLSGAAEPPEKVLDGNGNVIRLIGEDKDGKPVEMEYYKPNKDNPSGHPWTLPEGNYTGKNNCLFNVVAAQVGEDPNELTENTAILMENGIENLANQAQDIK